MSEYFLIGIIAGYIASEFITLYWVDIKKWFLWTFRAEYMKKRQENHERIINRFQGRDVVLTIGEERIKGVATKDVEHFEGGVK